MVDNKIKMLEYNFINILGEINAEIQNCLKQLDEIEGNEKEEERLLGDIVKLNKMKRLASF